LKKIIYVDMDDVLCAYTSAHRHALSNNPDIAFPQSVVGFFQFLEPVDRAIEAVNELRTLFDVFVLTAPSTRNAHSYSEKRIWIEEHFDYSFTKKLIISPDKGLLKGDCLIDDHTSGNGQERFEGLLVEFGSDVFPDWNAVLAFLRPQTGSPATR
jgi:5'-nucleotidase